MKIIELFSARFVTQIAGGTMTWCPKEIKPTICLSSTESEYIFASVGIREME